MKHLKRYNKYNLETRCRICLSQGVTRSVSLTEPLEGNSKLLVYEALEFITKEKIPMTKKYPGSLCGMCYGLLKISYDLINQYHTSQTILKRQLEEPEEKEPISSLKDSPLHQSEGEPHTESNPTTNAPVELIVGGQQFNLEDLVIIEDNKKDKPSYEGFLKNLGTSISASFVSKNYQKPKLKVEPPSLDIKRLTDQNADAMMENILISVMPQEHNSDQTESVFVGDSLNIHSATLDSSAKDDIIKSALEMKYRCPYCRKPMASRNRAQLHASKCRNNHLTATCYVCQEPFRNRRRLINHIKHAHLTNLPKSFLKKDLGYKCFKCDKAFPSAGGLSYHMLKHEGRNHQCAQCGKTFYAPYQLKTHLESHEKGIVRSICPICGKGFHYRGAMQYHMKLHNNKKHENFSCNYCSKKCITKLGLKRHELIHTGLRPYKCKYCDKAFRSIGEQTKHQYLHTGVRPYSCRYCDMGFTQTHNMKMHWMTHKGEYTCEHCYRGFKDMDILKFHLRMKHPEEAVKGDADEGSAINDDAVDEIEEVSLESTEDQLENYCIEQYSVSENEEKSEAVILETYLIKLIE